MQIKTSEQIPSTMSAVVLERSRTLTLKQIPTWPIESYGDSDIVLVKVAACGVCGSDFRYYEGENPWAQATLGRYIENPPNIVLGHEVAGEVVAVIGSRNAHLLGKRVAVLDWKSCGTCAPCRSEHSNICSHMIHLGHGQGWGEQPYYPGAYAQFVPAWGASCLEIPKNISYGEAAMMDILAVAVHVARRGNVKPGEPALVMGAGPAGNSIAQVVRHLGASPVVITDRAETPLELARKRQIDNVVDVRNKLSQEVAAEVLALAPDGYASVYDSIGTDESFKLGLEATSTSGTMVEMAVHDSNVNINFLKLGSERCVTTSCNFEPKDFPIAMKWLESGRFFVRDWITGIGLKDVPRRFEQAMSTGRGAFKLLIEF
jgi:threonine dehydrogenase-like Zn-dependent dehydrogenase